MCSTHSPKPSCPATPVAKIGVQLIAGQGGLRQQAIATHPCRLHETSKKSRALFLAALRATSSSTCPSRASQNSTNSDVADQLTTISPPKAGGQGLPPPVLPSRRPPPPLSLGSHRRPHSTRDMFSSRNSQARVHLKPGDLHSEAGQFIFTGGGAQLRGRENARARCRQSGATADVTREQVGSEGTQGKDCNRGGWGGPRYALARPYEMAAAWTGERQCGMTCALHCYRMEVRYTEYTWTKLVGSARSFAPLAARLAQPTMHRRQGGRRGQGWHAGAGAPAHSGPAHWL